MTIIDAIKKAMANHILDTIVLHDCICTHISASAELEFQINKSIDKSCTLATEEFLETDEKKPSNADFYFHFQLTIPADVRLLAITMSKFDAAKINTINGSNGLIINLADDIEKQDVALYDTEAKAIHLYSLGIRDIANKQGLRLSGIDI